MTPVTLIFVIGMFQDTKIKSKMLLKHVKSTHE